MKRVRGAMGIGIFGIGLLGGRALASPLNLFVEPRDGVTPILAAIGSAHRTIDVEVYMATDRQVLGALETAAHRGVRVRVILERHPYGGGARYARRAYQSLSTGGCQVRWSDPEFTYTHEKAMVVDDREAVILTCNLSWSAFHRNREYGIVDRDSRDVGALASLFADDWSGKPAASDAAVVKDAALVVSPVDARPALLGLIASARRQILVQDEEIADPGAISALGRKAAAGVDVRIELPGSRRRVSARTLETVALLRQAGIRRIRLMTRRYLHAKLIVVDARRAYLGSINLSETSLDRNREVGRLLSDPALVGRLHQVFLADWDGARRP